MNGQPVWLASASLRDRNGRLLPSREWHRTRDGDRARKVLYRTLDGVGDQHRQRLFRMPITVCLHRAATDQEVRGLPDWWRDVPAAHLAGGSVEILWETEPGSPSTRPCLAPRDVTLDGWGRLPAIEDCGDCEPCHARAGIEEPEDAR